MLKKKRAPYNLQPLKRFPPEKRRFDFFDFNNF